MKLNQIHLLSIKHYFICHSLTRIISLHQNYSRLKKIPIIFVCFIQKYVYLNLITQQTVNSMGCINQQNHIPKQKPIQRNIKLIFYGEAGVGKSSIQSHYKQGSYHGQMRTWYLQRRLKAQTGQIMIVNIWDTCGEERYETMMPLYFRNVSIVLLVFDLTDHHSFLKTDYFLEKIKEKVELSKVVMFLVGNKSDLTEQRKIFEDQGQKKAKEIENCFYHQTSARTGKGVTELFQRAVDELAKIDKYTFN